MAILVGYDESEAAVRALEHAAAQAGATHKRLVVLAVFEMPLDPRDPPQFGTAGDGTPYTGPLEAPPQIAEILQDARTRLEGTGVIAEYLWAPGEPARLIVDAARERKATTIVIGHHHHGMLARLFGNDVAGEVLQIADCEVVVVD
jgi:nucleotide-binding universal stress UspA family protein